MISEFVADPPARLIAVSVGHAIAACEGSLSGSGTGSCSHDLQLCETADGVDVSADERRADRGRSRALGYPATPWERLQGPASHFLAITDVRPGQRCAGSDRWIRAIHERVTATAPAGRPYAASDLHLLT